MIGVLNGTGIGPEVIGATLLVLEAIARTTGINFDIRRGGAIGEESREQCGVWLPQDVVQFCEDIFACGGAILNGPGGGRYVYDLRQRFDLFCKFVPMRPFPALAGVGRIVPRHLKNVDIVIVRDNSGGVYQGRWSERSTPEGRVAEHAFEYGEAQVHAKCF